MKKEICEKLGIEINKNNKINCPKLNQVVNMDICNFDNCNYFLDYWEHSSNPNKFIKRKVICGFKEDLTRKELKNDFKMKGD